MSEIEAGLRLRAPCPEDIAPYAAFLADTEVSRWLDDVCQRPLTLQQVEAFLFQDLWCRWSITWHGAFIGFTGLEWTRSHLGTARFFIVIGSRGLWGRGIGTAVLARVLDHGFQRLGLRRITSDYLEPNVASRRIHLRNGFVEEGRLRQDTWRDGQWTDRLLSSMLREDFMTRRSLEQPAGAPGTRLPT